MKNLFKNPLFYTNILLLALVVALAANTNITYAKLSDWVSQTFAAVGPITGEGTVNFFTAFAGGSNQIGDSAIYQDASGHIGIGTGASTFDSRFEILSSIDRFIELIRSGATYPTVFRQGTDGALVVNNSNIDTLTLKSGNVGIGMAPSSNKLGVTGVFGQYAAYFYNPAAVGSSYGVYIQAGGNSGDTALAVDNLTGGVPFFYIKGSGNVGIGTAAPGAKLEVNGQIKITGGTPGAGKVLTSDASGLASWATSSGGLPSGTSGQTLRNDGTGWVANSVLFNNGTNVGIGTAAVGNQLSLANAGFLAWRNGLNDGENVRVGTNSGNELLLQTGTVASTPVTRVTIQAAGNVGIGDTTPEEKLTVIGGFKLADANSRIYFGNNGGTSYRALEGSMDGASLQIGEGYAKTLMYGNVGIGTTNPGAKLEVAGWANVDGITNNGRLLVGGVGETTEISFSTTNGWDKMFISNAGNVGIGTTNPQAPLHVNGAMMLTPLAADPASPVSGMIWLRQ